MKEHEDALQDAAKDYNTKLSAAEAKHKQEMAKATEMAEAAQADVKTAREAAESRVADLEVMLEDKKAEIEKLQGEIKQHEMEKAVKDAQGGTLVECVFADPGPLGIGETVCAVCGRKLRSTNMMNVRHAVIFSCRI